jgi:sec-independent protein translocase protein TatA
MILGLGVPEILIVLVIVLLIFGPKNLPKLGSAMGKTVKNVREGMEGDDDAEDKDAEKKAVDADDEDADKDSDKDSDKNE